LPAVETIDSLKKEVSYTEAADRGSISGDERGYKDVTG